jgi:hypothetical protein
MKSVLYLQVVSAAAARLVSAPFLAQTIWAVVHWERHRE